MEGDILLEDALLVVNQSQPLLDKSLSLETIGQLLWAMQGITHGNKRTARIVCNASLINNQYCPISFRTVDSVDYKKAMLLFYEQNNISEIKKIIIDQFEFAVNTYF